jgi:hypothetical protein
METCYKMVRADLMKSLPLTAERFGIEPELTARLAQSRAIIYELPISYAGRTYAEGKKINWKDGFSALWHILKCNLAGPRPPVFRTGGEARPLLAAAHPRSASPADAPEPVERPNGATAPRPSPRASAPDPG